MQEYMIKTLATEAMKPASSIIDALLAPKIESIRKLAKKRELQGKLEDKAVNNLLENYFRKLLRRVSGIKTLVFPEQVLPLTTIYEPLQLAVTISKQDKDIQRKDVTPNNSLDPIRK